MNAAPKVNIKNAIVSIKPPFVFWLVGEMGIEPMTTCL